MSAPLDPIKRARALLDRVTGAPDAEVGDVVRAAVSYLRDEDPRVRVAALDALSRLAAFRGVELDLGIAERVLELAADPDDRVRSEAAIAIALLPEPLVGAEARALLVRLLQDASPRVRREAAAALGDVGERSAVDRLASGLDDEDEVARFEAAYALAVLGDDRGLELLVSALGETKRRLDACEALRRLGSPRAVPALERLAGRLLLGWADRLTALATLYAVGARSPAAEKILERTFARNREERTYALALLGTHHILEGSGRLAEVAAAPRDPLRDTAVRALGELGVEEALPVLVAVVEEESAPIELRLDAIGAITKLPASARARALEALSGVQDVSLSDALEEALSAAGLSRERPGRRGTEER